MTSTFWRGEIWRWVLALAAVVFAFFGMLYFGLFVLFFSSFPQDLAAPTAGFLMGLIIVLSGSLLAPRQQNLTAILLLVLVVLLNAFLLRFPILSTLIGGLSAVVFVAWRFHPRRTAASKLYGGIAVFTACLAFSAFAYTRYIDFPARAQKLPLELSQSLGAKASQVNRFYRYDLGGFIDRQWLWRIDAKPEIVSLLVSHLGLQRTTVVSPGFWRMPPYYWPRSLPGDAEVFQSPGFSADSRGQDGEYYFLVHDKAQNRAFLWLKSNF
jgi:hypothetical protein